MVDIVTWEDGKLQKELVRFGEFVPGLRTEETNLGDLIADAILWEAQLHAEDTPDLAIENGGSIHSSLPEGDITLGQITALLPFINYICTTKVTSLPESSLRALRPKLTPY